MGNLSPFSPLNYERDSKEYWKAMYFEESKKYERLRQILWHIDAHVAHCLKDQPIQRAEMWRIIQNNLHFWQGLLNENNKLRLKNERLRTRLALLQEKRDANAMMERVHPFQKEIENQ